MQHGNIFRIRLLLASKGASDIGCPDPHLVARHIEDVLAQNAVEEVCPLAWGNQREAGVVGIVRADAAAWLVGLAMTRLLTSFTFVTCAAWAKACSTAARSP